MTRSEAIIISAAVAIAMLPRVESKVQTYVSTHRTEIQMAMNELQGKQPVPFAAPDVAPAAIPAPDLQLAMDGIPPLPPTAVVRVERARLRPAMLAARRAQFEVMKLQGLQNLENLQNLQKVNIVMAKQKAAFTIYRATVKHCPSPPAAPAAPSAESVSIASSSF